MQFLDTNHVFNFMFYWRFLVFNVLGQVVNVGVGGGWGWRETLTDETRNVNLEHTELSGWIRSENKFLQIQ